MPKYDTTYDPTALIAERLAQHKALAESHAELVAALTRFHIQHDKGAEDHFVLCGSGHESLASDATQRCAQAQAALDKARKL